MGVKATEIRKGQVIEKNGDLLLVTAYEHRTPGNWRAIITVKTKSLKSGATNSIRYGSGDMVELAYLDRRKAEYLYKDGAGYVFMDAENYEQFTLPADLADAYMGFVRENTTIEITFHDSSPIGIELPTSVVLKVTESENAVRGNTASNVKKEAILETGLKIKVPIHIKVDEEIRVSTDTGEFQGRAN